MCHTGTVSLLILGAWKFLCVFTELVKLIDERGTQYVVLGYICPTKYFCGTITYTPCVWCVQH